MTNDINTVTTVTTSLLFLKEGEDRGSIEKVRKGGEVVTNDDGEQGPDTDGLGATRLMPPREMEGCTIRFVECGIGHGRLTADNWINEGCPYCRIAAIQARIARKEAANEALVAKLGATLADMRSLQRQADNWRAECVRLSALLVEKEAQLAQRMAMPANALRHGGGR